MEWYVIQVYSSCEKAVQRSLKERIANSGLSCQFGEVLIPTEKIIDVKDGRRSEAERKFFPGYILVQMEISDSSWHLVKSTPKVQGFLGSSKASTRPTPISKREVNSLLNQIQEGKEKPKPRILFDVGEKVRIIDGPFTDFNADIEEANYDRRKLKAIVEIFGRGTPVELDFSQVEKI